MLDLHENRVKEAEEHTKKALEIMKTYHSTNGRFLLSKLKYVQSALARRMGDYSTARELLEDSVEVNGSGYYDFVMHWSFLSLPKHVLLTLSRPICLPVGGGRKGGTGLEGGLLTKFGSRGNINFNDD